MIRFKEFKRLEMKVGTIQEIEDMPGSQKLIKMKVDFGGEIRQVLAGLKNIINPEEIKGKQYVFVTNLEPARMMGQLSEAMVLAAVEGEKVVLVKPEKEVSNGTMIE